MLEAFTHEPSVTTPVPTRESMTRQLDHLSQIGAGYITEDQIIDAIAGFDSVQRAELHTGIYMPSETIAQRADISLGYMRGVAGEYLLEFAGIESGGGIRHEFVRVTKAQRSETLHQRTSRSARKKKLEGPLSPVEARGIVSLLRESI